MNSEKIITNMFLQAGININGNMPHDIQVHDKRFYKLILNERDLGLGESYVNGWWDCNAIDQFLTKALKAKIDKNLKISLKTIFHMLMYKLFNLQKKSRAYQVGEKHYDLDNTLYSAMLDTRLNYTCAYWKNAKSLDEAQEDKLNLICKKIGLKKGVTVLDIGCGYGSFAKYATEKYGAKVTGITISKEQLKLAKKLCNTLEVELLLKDYREVYGQYDAVISIGMFEHVGRKNYKTYMEVVKRCLKKKGIAFIQTIGSNDSSTVAPTMWINKYIFPNSMIPAINDIIKATNQSFIIEDWHNFGPYYDKTLMAWYKNFINARSQLKNKYNERFMRMWCFYLLSCAAYFRTRQLQLWQIVMTKTGTQQPNCRIS